MTNLTINTKYGTVQFTKNKLSDGLWNKPLGDLSVEIFGPRGGSHAFCTIDKGELRNLRQLIDEILEGE